MVMRHSFTIDEWHLMGEAGLFGEDARVELLDGEVIEMPPIGSRHGGTVNKLNHLLTAAVGDRAVIAPQNPVVLDQRSEPQPDLAVLAARPDFYTEAHARPDEILLLIEVSDSSLVYDRDWKAPYYAKSGVRACWIVDLTASTVVIMSEPGPGGYAEVVVKAPGDSVDLPGIDGVRIAVADIL